MESSYARFLDGVHAEHIDEAAFLFEQVLNLSDTDQLPWPVLGSFEARFEAHLDALVLGGDRAWRLCCTHVDRQTVGVLHVCLALACRARQAGRVAQVLRDAELSQPELVRAATLALARELPPDWHVFVEQGLGRRDRLLPVLAAVAGQRRLPCLPALLAAMPLAPARCAAGAAARTRSAGRARRPCPCACTPGGRCAGGSSGGPAGRAATWRQGNSGIANRVILD
ncbi:MAG: hypothetical protein U5L05_14545 [Rubrivivax sp.]|nr:hypothetical protein [Rubrivivax sp.]